MQSKQAHNQTKRTNKIGQGGRGVGGFFNVELPTNKTALTKQTTLTNKHTYKHNKHNEPTKKHNKQANQHNQNKQIQQTT